MSAPRRPRHPGLGLALALLLTPAATPAAALNTYKYAAFGDSITAGTCGGDQIYQTYPDKLEFFLTNRSQEGWDAVVENRGLGGETTFDALQINDVGTSRIQRVLDNVQPEVLLLMEGTNDITRMIKDNDFTLADVVANLEEMAQMAEDRDIDTVHASVIPRNPPNTSGAVDLDNEETSQLGADIAAMSTATGNARWFVDTFQHFHGLNPKDDWYRTSECPKDRVGHPNNEGNKELASVFRDSFTVSCTLPHTPSPTSPAEPQGVISKSKPTFRWNDQGTCTMGRRATWYKLRIESEDGLPDQDEWVVAEDNCAAGECSWEIVGDLADGDYSWKVRGRNPRGYGSWSIKTDFSVVSSPPGMATLNNPQGTLTCGPITYSWQEEVLATDYQLEVTASVGSSPDPEFYGAEICAAGTCSVTPAVDLAPGDYDWRVESSNGAGGTWSDPLAFTVQPLPQGPPLSPVADTTDPQPQFSWQEVANAVEYQLQVERDDGGWTEEHTSAWTAATGICSGGACALDLPAPLTAGELYHWRVVARRPDSSCHTVPLDPADPAAVWEEFSVVTCEDLLLNGETPEAKTYSACNAIRALNFNIPSTSPPDSFQVIFHAGSVIELGDNFSVGEGAELILETDP